MHTKDFGLFTDHAAAVLAIGGFIIGVGFGAVGIVTNFRTMDAIAVKGFAL
jgi:hypothetical protein